MKFDIIIYGVQKRISNINKLKEKLSSQIDNQDISVKVILDDRTVNNSVRPNGSFYTAKLAWNSEWDLDITHRICLQDDVDISDNFIEVVTKIITNHPNAIITLMPYLPDVQVEDLVTELKTKDTPYIIPSRTSGPGVIIPTKYINDIWYGRSITKPRVFYERDDRDEDIMFAYYANRNNIKYLSTWPAIILHLGEDSIINTTLGSRRNDDSFMKVAQANWDNIDIVDSKQFMQKGKIAWNLI